MSDGGSISAFEHAELELARSLDLQLEIEWLTVPGIGRLRVLESGGGSPVLFVHGGGAAAAVWLPVWAELSGRRLIALDRPGCGLSGPFDYRHVAFRRHAVSVLDAVIAARGGRADVVGNSMGGLWALWLAVDRPLRVASMVQLGAPALFAGAGIPLPLRLLARRGIGPLLGRLEPPSPGQARRLLRRLGHHDDVDAGRVPPELLAWWVALQRLPWYAASWRSLLAAVVRLLRESAEPIAPEHLARVQARCLFLWSTTDPFGSPTTSAAEFIDGMPDARLRVVPGGHLPWLSDPAGRARDIERFLLPVEARP